MKRLTINETWEQCLAMWKWISRQCYGKSKAWCASHTCHLKVRWLEENGYKVRLICQACFFCDYTTKSLSDSYHCEVCPAKKIESDFCCRHGGNADYNSEVFFRHYPRLFYAELKRLNKIRLEKKQ